jgi:uncharacterized protein YecE (DUF72 family)
MAFDAGRLAEFFDLLPRTTADAAALAARHDAKVPDDRALVSAATDRPILHAVEPRHASFAGGQARDLFAREGICMVTSDSAGTWPQVDADTSAIRYARLHGEARLYGGGYSEASLDRWAERVRSWLDAGRDAYVYFDNDADGRAPHDAAALLARLA